MKSGKNTDLAAATKTVPFATITNSDIENATVENFINDIAREKPIRFTRQQLDGFTSNYATRLGSGGFGVVYKGEFPNGIGVAVKVLNGDLDYKSAEQQFITEVSTIGRTFHAKLVRIYGFCFDSKVRALVYEYMPNGSLDTYLFHKTHVLAWEKLHEIAIETARALTYLHEECEQRIIHYDIKPANILLDLNFSPKVADFGLAKLYNGENTHVSMAVGRGTPGYAAPEIGMGLPVTHKCDVYSFGMLLFELVGRRRNFNVSLEEDERWFPKWVWERYENGEVEKVMVKSRIEDEHKGAAERMLMVAFWCVQYQPERRPPMSKVVKMLEGEMEIMPPLNPFQHLLSSSASCLDFWDDMSSSSAGVSGKSNPMNAILKENFINDIAREKPIRFTMQQLADFTRNYATRLGSGGYGVVYKGEIPKGIAVAVKVLNGNLDYKIVEQQFMAEMHTFGTTFHANIVRIYGFCFDPIVRALVFEYMPNGSLDEYLFKETHATAWEKLCEIAIGTARALAYLHDECEQRIIHYDIKPANILLDFNLSPKVADFGLARLCNKEDTHVSMTARKGTPGYTAPEMWMGLPVTYKCDVYSFGMLLFELVGRRRNYNETLEEDERWFPKWVWERYEKGEVEKVMVKSRIEDEHKGAAERMLMVAFWCVQYQPENRPPMSQVVKMLEGEMEIKPPSNPWPYLSSSEMTTLDKFILEGIEPTPPISSSAGATIKKNAMKHGKNSKKAAFPTIKNSDIENATVENFQNDLNQRIFSLIKELEG